MVVSGGLSSRPGLDLYFEFHQRRTSVFVHVVCVCVCVCVCVRVCHGERGVTDEGVEGGVGGHPPHLVDGLKGEDVLVVVGAPQGAAGAAAGAQVTGREGHRAAWGREREREGKRKRERHTHTHTHKQIKI